MPDKKIIYIAGLPRSGSTFLSQVLGHHPLVYSNGHSSPLSGILSGIRHQVSDSDFFLSQLDVNFEQCYQQLHNANIGFINGWFSTVDEHVVVDKNRLWLSMIETLAILDPDFKMIVCLRDLRQIFGSIEQQHRKTRLIDYPGHINPNSAFNRAQGFFSESGVVGMPLRSIENMQDVTDPQIRKRILYLCYESFVKRPQAVISDVFKWLELPNFEIDFERLNSTPHESDSYYRMKFPHVTKSYLKPALNHTIPERIEEMIINEFSWYYRQFYPDALPDK